MKKVLITGVSSGIGESAYNIFLKNNYDCYGIDKDYSEINNFYQINVNNYNALGKLFNIFKEKNIKFDVIIPSAVYQNKVGFNNLTVDDFNLTIDTNIKGIFNVIKLALENNILNKNAKFIIPTSIHCNKPRLNHLAYDISKAGITMMIKELAIEFANYGYTINGVSFGAVRTPLNKDWINNTEEVNKVLPKIPMKKILEPNDIACFIYNMTTDIFKYCTGSIYEIDGGRHLL